MVRDDRRPAQGPARKHAATSVLFALAAALSASAAQAKSANDPTASAMDAFGQSAGLEQIGLYNGSQIRGFDPQNSGAYRVDGAYFARAGGIADGAIDGVGIRVGVNAARLTYPSPSGIVDIHLKGFSPGERTLDVALDSFAWFSPALDLNYAIASATGRVGIAGGAEIRPSVTYPDRSKTQEYFTGAVPAWRLSDRVRLRALLSYGHVDYDRGVWGNVLRGDRLPPVQSTDVLLPPRERQGSEYAANVGVLLDGVFDHGWRFGASAIHSADGASYDFTSFHYDATPLVHAALSHVAEQTTVATALELRGSRDFRLGPADNRLAAALRYRHREAINSDTPSFDLGIVRADRPIFPPAPQAQDDGLRSHDIVNQSVASFDYTGVFWNRFEFRAGVDLTRYNEHFRPLTGASSGSTHTYGFPHASVIYSPSSRLALFASYVRGLEDSGVAPTFAVNANQVLPPVLAEQSEVGLRRSLTPVLSLILAAFDVHKPTTGLRRDGVFTLVAEERHRGVELSVSGRLAPGTRIVLGAAVMDQRLSGPLVSAGVIGRHPVGTAPTVLTANVVQVLPFAPDWSVDAQFRWFAPKYVNTSNTVRSSAIGLLNIGARRHLRIGHTPAELRVVATNVLNVRDWNVQSSGAITPVDRPTVWGTLTFSLAGGS